jgi:two-component system, NtrC family, response regulator HydG
MAEKILVVDDEPLVLGAVERALLKQGYKITKAQNTKEFVSALKQSPFHLLITDMFMDWNTSEGIISKVKEVSPAIKVLCMSGTVDRSKKYPFIEKPFRINDLRKKVRDILDDLS